MKIIETYAVVYESKLQLLYKTIYKGQDMYLIKRTHINGDELTGLVQIATDKAIELIQNTPQ